MEKNYVTNNYSMEIIVKICGTLASFLVFIFISAWHLTRRKYRFPYFIQENFPITNVKDLLSFHFLNNCYNESKDKFNCGVIAARAFDGRIAVVINDISWCLNDKPNPIISIPFSLTPKCIKQRWRGIIFNHDSSEPDVLRCLIIKGFESIDWTVLDKSITFGLRFSNNKEINVELSAQLVAFESIMGYSVDAENLDKKIIFISKIVALIEEFSRYFYYGKLSSSDDLSNVSHYADSVTKLLQPVIESAIYHSDSQYSSSNLVNAVSENVLSQITKLRHHLREENASCNMLTADNFCHVMFEHYFIWKEVLGKCLRGLQHLVTIAPDIVDNIRSELKKEAFINMKIQLSESHLEANTSLVYTKSVTQELLRLLGIGIDYDLRLTERDGSIGGFDLTEQSIIVLNHFAFARSKCYHVSSATDAELFRASRFVKYDSAEQKYMFYNSQKLCIFQDQCHVVGLPRNFICRFVLLLLIKLAFPDFVIDMKSPVNVSDAQQYELMYHLDKQFVWNWTDVNEE